MPILINGNKITKVNVIKNNITTTLSQVNMSSGEVVYKNKIPIKVELLFRSGYVRQSGGYNYFYTDLDATLVAEKGFDAAVTITASFYENGGTFKQVLNDNNHYAEFEPERPNTRRSYSADVTVTTSYGETKSAHFAKLDWPSSNYKEESKDLIFPGE